MIQKAKAYETKDNTKAKVLSICFIVILALYPLRHVTWGLDLWDTGYSYANFTYMGLEHMDSMWLLSTFLANVFGHFLTMLPFGNTLLGLNIYTGLLVSLFCVLVYLFFVKIMKIPRWIAFLGEFIACSLCWGPTASLYHYMTYGFFLFACLFLYKGLTENRGVFLFLAGICLGINVLVRFPNITEAAMIVAVWAYVIIEKLGSKEKKWKSIFSQIGIKTLWCLSGYLTALIALFSYIHLRYGMNVYVEGIKRLFAMTDTATDYKATSMLTNSIRPYVDMLYWISRIAFFVVVGMILFALTNVLLHHISFVKSRKAVQKAIEVFRYCRTWVLSVAAVVWLYGNGFTSFFFYSYDSIYRPAALFLMLTMLIGLIVVFHKDCSNQEKLISILIIGVILLTPLGGNNNIYPSINNLFLAAPYTLWMSMRFLKWSGGRLKVVLYPIKTMLITLFVMFLFQVTCFGGVFQFAEATGVQDVSAKVSNNEVLRNIRMSSQKAEWLEEITQYVNDNDLKGQEVILYGWIPSLSFYLEMPSAFNPWSDLDSYQVTKMQQDLEQLEREMQEDSTKCPIIILESSYGLDSKDTQANEDKISKEPKWKLLTEFMQSHQYKIAFENEKFILLRP